jgi:hypothetical protein
MIRRLILPGRRCFVADLVPGCASRCNSACSTGGPRVTLSTCTPTDDEEFLE